MTDGFVWNYDFPPGTKVHQLGDPNIYTVIDRFTEDGYQYYELSNCNCVLGSYLKRAEEYE